MTSGVAALPASSRLSLVQDQTNRLHFLVDTEAAVSILPPSCKDRQTGGNGWFLHVANDFSIAVFGDHFLNVDLGFQDVFSWIFAVADVWHPILRADFLHHFNRLEDMNSYQLVHLATHRCVTGVATKLPAISPTFLPTIRSDFDQLLHNFPEITHPLSYEVPIKHKVTHHIITQGPSVVSRPRRLPPDRFQAAKQEFQHL